MCIKKHNVCLVSCFVEFIYLFFFVNLLSLLTQVAVATANYDLNYNLLMYYIQLLVIFGSVLC